MAKSPVLALLRTISPLSKSVNYRERVPSSRLVVPLKAMLFPRVCRVVTGFRTSVPACPVLSGVE